MINKFVNLYEYQKLKNKEFKKKIEKCLDHEIPKDYLRRVKGELHGINSKLNSKIIQLNYDSIQATQYVGFIKLKDFSIQIIPKIYKEDKELPNLQYLIFVLKYLEVYGISLKKLDYGFFGKTKGDLFEFLIEMFITKLKEQIYKGIYRKYIETTENTEYIKGKLLIDNQIKYNIVKPWKFYCKFEEFIENNLMNQIFKYTLTILKKNIKIISSRRVIDELLSLFLNVSLVKIQLYHFKKIHYTRLNAFYEPLINFCNLIISQSNIDFQNRTIESFYFLFDMNRLFERFITKFIKNHQELIKINKKFDIIKVEDQLQIGSLFEFFNLKPDLVITYRSEESIHKILLDFKYKVLTSEDSHYGISQSDFYQMFAYSQSQLEKYNKIILLYPRTRQSKTRVFKHKIGKKNHNIEIFVDFVDIENIYDAKNKLFNQMDFINELNILFDMERLNIVKFYY